jgi:hypothetical protein
MTKMGMKKDPSKKPMYIKRSKPLFGKKKASNSTTATKPLTGADSTVKRKIPKKSRSQIVKQLDIAFSRYIRMLYAESVNGEWVVKCVTCDVVKPVKEMQAGHYISRGKYPTRWDEQNVHPQCVACNVLRNGNYTEYARFMVRTYGADFLDIIALRATRLSKTSTIDLQQKISYYEAETKKKTVTIP